ncbi:sideroflexin-2 [Orussus abietinus]|uniref:sideroflexin-2 n=1 Tax=Orussus abietinus TaxID=222816 RepID=UPI000625892F|nr:sideroflexin-2 [Orussus abietinus]
MDSFRFISQWISHDRRLSDDVIKTPPDQVENVEKPGGDPQKEETINVDQPLWPQDTYLGRWRHFAFITDCRTILVSTEKLLAAKKLCEDYKGMVDSGLDQEKIGITREEIIYAKKLRDSSFHPDNGELTNVIGRMSFQFPGCVFITGGMLAFYKSAKAVLGWQFFNQSFNAVVNYTNRNAKSDSEGDANVVKQAFICATVASCGAALGFRKLLAGRGPLFARWAPFFAVAMGNMTNLPIMRQREIARGIELSSKDDAESPLMCSQLAAVKAIGECVITRIVMAAPGMIFIPVIMNGIKPYCFYQTRPWIGLPIEIALCSAILLIMIPSALAIYPQRNSLNVALLKLIPEEYDEFQEKAQRKQLDLNILYYNKGL